MFRSLLKLARRNARSGEFLSLVIEFCASCLCVNGSARCLKDFIKQLNTKSARTESENEAITNAIFSSLTIILSTKTMKEVFVFKGTQNSGIALQERKALPKDGFCFFGSIRIERKNPSTPVRMAIFKLKGLELLLEDNCLHYCVPASNPVDRRAKRGGGEGDSKAIREQTRRRQVVFC